MTVSSVKLFFFITFFQRFVSAQFCRLCLSDGSHLLQDALKESLKPQTEHISYFPITQADCHCVCETCWWRATDPTTQLTVIVFAKFSDEEPQIRPEKPGHFSSSPNCATVRYFWTSAFLVGSPNSHQVKYADFFKQLSTKSTTTIKAKAVTEQNLQFAAQGQIGHSLCRGQCSSGQPRIAGLGAHRCCSESRLSSVTIWFSRRAPQTSDSHQMKREARQSWSSSVAADIGHAECTFLENMARSASAWPLFMQFGLNAYHSWPASWASFFLRSCSLMLRPGKVWCQIMKASKLAKWK